MTKIVYKKRGHMPGLAKHLAKELGGDPHFFTKCMGHESITNYDKEIRSAICAKAHKLVTGIWPGEHSRSERKKSIRLKAKKPTITIVIDNEEDDDWMKTLPGYQDEVAIHEELARKHANRNSS